MVRDGVQGTDRTDHKFMNANLMSLTVTVKHAGKVRTNPNSESKSNFA